MKEYFREDCYTGRHLLWVVAHNAPLPITSGPENYPIVFISHNPVSTIPARRSVFAVSHGAGHSYAGTGGQRRSRRLRRPRPPGAREPRPHDTDNEPAPSCAGYSGGTPVPATNRWRPRTHTGAYVATHYSRYRLARAAGNVEAGKGRHIRVVKIRESAFRPVFISMPGMT